MLATFVLSALTGFSSPLPFAAVVLLCLVYAAAIQADSAALTAGAVASSPVGHRGATLAVHSTLGFGGSLFAPALVGVVLDRAAPLGAATAWGSRSSRWDRWRCWATSSSWCSVGVWPPGRRPIGSHRAAGNPCMQGSTGRGSPTNCRFRTQEASCRKQATLRPEPTPSRGGCSCRQRSMAWGQRVWNEQPRGG